MAIRWGVWAQFPGWGNTAIGKSLGEKRFTNFTDDK